MSEVTRKPFSEIESDYQFFVDHSNEAAQVLAYVENEVRFRCESAPSALRLLDYGCGDGKFSACLTGALRGMKNEIHVSLVEPSAGYLEQASSRFSEPGFLQQSAKSIREIRGTFDLILANHVLYYVNDLKQCLRDLESVAEMNSVAWVTLGNERNSLIQICSAAHRMLDRAYPFYQSKDLETLLQKEARVYKKTEVTSQLQCQDREENRLKLLRFILGREINASNFLCLLDPFVKKDQIVLPLHDDVFSVSLYPTENQIDIRIAS